MELRRIQRKMRRVGASGIRPRATGFTRRSFAGGRRALVTLRAAVLAGWLDAPQRGPALLDDQPLRRKPEAASAAIAGSPLRAPLRQGLTVASLAAVIAVAPVSAQAPAQVGSGPQPASRSEHVRDGSAGWSRAMAGRLPAPDAPDVRGAPVPVADAPIDAAFDARGVIRPGGAPAAAKPKRTYEVTLYRAKAGDSAWTVARQFGVSTMTIWWANRVEAWDRLRVGQLLRVLPISGIEHIVRDGDTLDSIARAYRADADAIADYNRLEGGVVILGQRIIVPDGRGGRYVAVEGIGRSATIPRLQPGQADRAPVDSVAVAKPLLAPTPSSPTGVKGSGGVAWPADPDWSAGPGPVTEPYVPAWDWGPFPGNTDGGPQPPGVSWPSGPNDGPDSFGRMGFLGERPGAAPDQAAGESPRGGRERSRGSEPPIVIPDDAPVPRGHGARDQGWPDGGPPPGPKQGNILTIDDDRLTLTESDARRTGSLLWPVYGGGRLTQSYHESHSGLDIADLRGTPILAAQSGRIVFAGYRDDRAGRTIYLKHGPELFTSYLHLWRVAVKAGDWVDRGQVIGYMGSTGFSTGSHVHFTLTAGPLPNYAPHNRDPLLYLRRR